MGAERWSPAEVGLFVGHILKKARIFRLSRGLVRRSDASTEKGAESWSPAKSTDGSSRTDSIRWPRARTSEGTAEATIAETTSCRFWVTFTVLCHRRQILVGANMRPPRHILSKAPCPARWVPPPRTRGVRDTARPVPQDSAEVWWPARLNTA
ncbi:60S ribosomal protein L4 [Forsythia ovata]|uniref:60S ribosomal protein L4 n=1 Tax=Forsythia ovata TaxID=205694 RepID=A0ABD1PJC5_9LAMI